MKISFKDLPCKLISRIYVDDLFIGEVRKDIWTSKWSLVPDFNISDIYYPEIADKYPSSYEAGKVMAASYNKKQSRKKGGAGYEFDLSEFGLNEILSFLKLEG